MISKAGAYGLLHRDREVPEPAQDFQVPLLVLASVGLVYGSLLAFRAPDVRGVIAYSRSRRWG